MQQTVDPYLLSAVKMETSDQMGSRMACGLLIDLASSNPEEVTNLLEIIMPVLFNVIEAEDVEFDIKLLAIGAVGDLCLAAECRF